MALVQHIDSDYQKSSMNTKIYFGSSSLLLKSYRSIINPVFSFFKKWFGIIGLILVTIASIPIAIVLYIFSTFLFSKLDNIVKKEKLDFKAKSESFSFEKIKKMEVFIDEMLSVFTPLEIELAEIKDVFIFKPLYKRVHSIAGNLKVIDDLCKDKYHLSKDDIFKTEDEFINYQRAFAELDDIWNYDSTPSEQKDAFKIKKQLKDKLHK